MCQTHGLVSIVRLIPPSIVSILSIVSAGQLVYPRLGMEPLTHVTRVTFNRSVVKRDENQMPSTRVGGPVPAHVVFDEVLEETLIATCVRAKKNVQPLICSYTPLVYLITISSPKITPCSFLSSYPNRKWTQPEGH